MVVERCFAKVVVHGNGAVSKGKGGSESSGRRFYPRRGGVARVLWHRQTLVEPSIDGGQHQQGEQGGTEQPPDDDRGQGLLHLGTRAGGQRHGDEAQAGHERRGEDGPQPKMRRVMRCLLRTLAFLAQPEDGGHQHQAVEHRHPEQGDEAHRRRDGQRHATHPQCQHASGHREGDVEVDEEGGPRRLEGEVQQQEDEQEGEGHHHREPAAGRLEVLELPSPIQPVARWQRHLSRDGRLRIADEAPHVPPPHVGLDGEAALEVLPADLGGPFIDFDPGNLGQGDELSRGAGDLDVAQLFHMLAGSRGEAHLEGEALLALQHRAHLLAAQRLDGIEHVPGVDAVAGDGLPVHPDARHGQPGDLLGLHVRGAGDPGEDRRELVPRALEDLQVFAVQLERHIRAHPGDELAHPQLDGLGVGEEAAGHLLLQGRVEGGDERVPVLARRPLLGGLEHHEDVADLHAHGVRGDLRAPRLGDDRAHLGKALEHLLDEGGLPQGLFQGHRGHPPGLERHGSLVQPGHELRPEEWDEGQAGDEHAEGSPHHRLAVGHAGAQGGLVEFPGARDDDALLLGRPERQDHGSERGDQGEREDEGGGQGAQDGDGHGREHLALDAREREHRKVDDADDDLAEGRRAADLHRRAVDHFVPLRGGERAAEPVVLLRDVAHRVLHDDERAVHDEAEVDGAQGHEVARDAQLPHADEGGQHAQGDDARDEQARAQVAQHQEEHHDDQESALQQVGGHRLEGLPHQLRAVIERVDRHPRRQGGADALHGLLHMVDDGAGVLPDAHHHDAGDRLAASVACDGPLAHERGVLHLGDVPHVDGDALGGGGDDDVADVLQRLDQPLSPDEHLLRPPGDVGPARVGVVALQGLEDLLERQAIGRHARGIELHLVGFQLAAEGVHFHHPWHRAQPGDELPLQYLPQLHGALALAADLELVNFSEPRGRGAHLGRAVAFGDVLPGLLEPLAHELAGEVDVRAVLEGDGDDGQAELGDGAKLLGARQAAHRRLDGHGDEPFHLHGAKPRRGGEDLHLHVGDIGDRVDGQLAQGPESEGRDDRGQQEDEDAVLDRKMDELIEHGADPLVRVAFAHALLGELGLEDEGALRHDGGALFEPFEDFDLRGGRGACLDLHRLELVRALRHEDDLLIGDLLDGLARNDEPLRAGPGLGGAPRADLRGGEHPWLEVALGIGQHDAHGGGARLLIHEVADVGHLALEVLAWQRLDGEVHGLARLDGRQLRLGDIQQRPERGEVSHGEERRGAAHFLSHGDGNLDHGPIERAARGEAAAVVLVRPERVDLLIGEAQRVQPGIGGVAVCLDGDVIALGLAHFPLAGDALGEQLLLAAEVLRGHLGLHRGREVVRACPAQVWALQVAEDLALLDALSQVHLDAGDPSRHSGGHLGHAALGEGQAGWDGEAHGQRLALDLGGLQARVAHGFRRQGDGLRVRRFSLMAMAFFVFSLRGTGRGGRLLLAPLREDEPPQQQRQQDKGSHGRLPMTRWSWARAVSNSSMASMWSRRASRVSRRMTSSSRKSILPAR
ncbi:hypothetical protein STIAU_3193 [Stigmatella aurantiaca DW4/3-1]|uniref:Uncharacterized protein n=1 Tax=Stigmatella aurantiaca (strain DW4/3-1) TaxID=378806 RepID=Q093I3_STIAD|nr:hypothetical protein STIAU_3193 [Stigmatella aurantiaca DW4/3-1]